MNETSKIARLYDLSKAQKKPYFEVKNVGSGVPEVIIDGIIGWDTTSGILIKELSEIAKTSSKLNIRINSPGGNVFEALAIYNYLTTSNFTERIVHVDGMAFSAASFLALAGTKVIMAPSAEMMIHNPYSVFEGTAEDFRTAADLLDKMKMKIVNIYAEKTGKTPEEISAMMDAETWMDGNEALELGFIDEVSEKMKVAACVNMEILDVFQVPEDFKKIQIALNKRSAERNQREAGLSRNGAKESVSETAQREAEKIAKDNEKINNFAKKIRSITNG